MGRHIFVPTIPLAIATIADPHARHEVLAIAWDDAHDPDDNDVREFTYLVLREDGAKRPSWILGTEVGGIFRASEP